MGLFGIIGNLTSVYVFWKMATQNFFDSLIIALTAFDTIFIIFTIVDYSFARGRYKHKITNWPVIWPCPKDLNRQLSISSWYPIQNVIHLLFLNSSWFVLTISYAAQFNRHKWYSECPENIFFQKFVDILLWIWMDDRIQQYIVTAE